MRTGGRLAGIVVTACMLATALVANSPARAAAAYTRTEVYIPSFDGTRLHAYVFRPSGAARTPVVFSATPYDNTGGSVAGTPNPLADGNVNPPSSLVAAGLFDRGYSYV